MKVKTFAFNPEEFITDIASFSHTECSIYIRLLSYIWITGPIEDPISPPNGDPNSPPNRGKNAISKLCRLLSSTPQEILEAWDVIGPKLTRLEDGTLVNLKLWQIRENEIIKKEKEIAGGKAGALKRWQKNSIASPIAPPLGTPMPSPIGGKNSGYIYNNTINNNLDYSIVDNNINKKGKKILKKSEPAPPAFEQVDLQKSWEDWVEHRKQKKQIITAKAKELQIAKLKTMSPQDAIATILHSIEKNYTGLYPPNNLAPTNAKTSKVEALKAKLGLSDTIDPNQLGRMAVFNLQRG